MSSREEKKKELDKLLEIMSTTSSSFQSVDIAERIATITKDLTEDFESEIEAELEKQKLPTDSK